MDNNIFVQWLTIFFQNLYCICMASLLAILLWENISFEKIIPNHIFDVLHILGYNEVDVIPNLQMSSQGLQHCVCKINC